MAAPFLFSLTKHEVDFIMVKTNIAYHEKVSIRKMNYRHSKIMQCAANDAVIGPRPGAIANMKNLELKMKTKIAKLALAAVAAIALTAGAMNARAAGQDIVDTAVSAGQFKTLAAALNAAGLVDTLKGPGPFTVFAPTDAAFAKLPAGTVENLLKPENKAQLTAVLTYHVVPGTVMASDVVKLKQAKTVNGQPVNVKTQGQVVMINEASVTATDIKASNGVIHVIDSVILPPNT
jgi:uncharacterized surface protein with fasciclin (FAS1) repeats